MAGEQSFDPMHLYGDVARRQPDDLGDRRCLDALKIEQDDAAVGGFERCDQAAQAFQHPGLIDCRFRIVGRKNHIRRFERNEASAAPVTCDVRGGDVMGNAIGPGAEPAAAVIGGKAAPKRQVHVLFQIACAVGIGFHCASQASDGRGV
eukprot:Opistho-1_new@109304